MISTPWAVQPNGSETATPTVLDPTSNPKYRITRDQIVSCNSRLIPQEFHRGHDNG